jgi:hypothetical protein
MLQRITYMHWEAIVFFRCIHILLKSENNGLQKYNEKLKNKDVFFHILARCVF